MVSVTVLVVSVWLVMDPWVKFGTTGTAWAGTALTSTVPAAITYGTIFFLITHDSYRTVTSDTNCVVTAVFAPPASTLAKV